MGSLSGSSDEFWREGIASCAHAGAAGSGSRASISVLYAFNPKRNAILLVGGDKTGNERWYEVNVPIADRLYDEHLEELKKEAAENG